jgi:hypothetical protein
MELNQRLLIVGNPDPIHLGSHLWNAAKTLGMAVELCDSREAFTAAWPIVKLNWWLRGHRPPLLESFSRKVVETCQRFRPRWLIATGISPLSQWAMKELEQLGVYKLNFLTDDPWNPAHHTSWFMQDLPLYDHVFTPRRANLEDLRRLGCQRISYLPFGYAPELHFPEPPSTPEECKRFAADLVFAGGADSDRVPYMVSMVNAGIKVALYGGYWQRYKETRECMRGYADPATLRKAIGGAKVSICLVRRANRDGHSMRTFEVPAVGACLLAEDTAEHREIFGEEMEAVSYFGDADEMISKLRWLLRHSAERRRMADAAQQLIVGGRHSYADRLLSMLNGDLSAA